MDRISAWIILLSPSLKNKNISFKSVFISVAAYLVFMADENFWIICFKAVLLKQEAHNPLFV